VQGQETADAWLPVTIGPNTIPPNWPVGKSEPLSTDIDSAACHGSRATVSVDSQWVMRLHNERAGELHSAHHQRLSCA